MLEVRWAAAGLQLFFQGADAEDSTARMLFTLRRMLGSVREVFMTTVLQNRSIFSLRW